MRRYTAPWFEKFKALQKFGELAALDPSIVTLYVDPVAGHDGASGYDAAHPFATIQAAVNRFLPPHDSARTIPRGTTWTVQVLYTQGMEALTEYVVVPAHTGDGVLVIRAQEEVIATSSFVSFTPIAGREVRQTLTADGSFALGYNNSSFVRLAQGGLIDPMDDFFENLPVVFVAGSTADVVVSDPGSNTALGYVPGVSIEQVHPIIAWRSTPAPGLFSGQPMITNLGGNLIVCGFFLQPDEAAGLATKLIENLSRADTVGLSPSVQLVRVVILASASGIAFNPIATGAVGLGGVIGLASAGGFRGAVGSWANVRWLMDPLNVSGFFRINEMIGAIYGLDMEQVTSIGGATSALVLERCKVDALFADMRAGARLSAAGFTGVRLYAFTCEGVPLEPCIEVGVLATESGDGHNEVITIGGSRIKGSVGNTGVGVEARAFGSLTSIVGLPSLTGTAGDLRIGSTLRTWAGGNFNDAAYLARYRLGA